MVRTKAEPIAGFNGAVRHFGPCGRRYRPESTRTSGQWSATNDKRPMGDDLTPRWPAHCESGPNLVRCGRDSLKGTLAMDGVGKRYSAALVKV